MQDMKQAPQPQGVKSVKRTILFAYGITMLLLLIALWVTMALYKAGKSWDYMTFAIMVVFTILGILASYVAISAAKSIRMIIVLLVSAALFSSCATTKKDCQGRKHYKHKGGFYVKCDQGHQHQVAKRSYRYSLTH